MLSLILALAAVSLRAQEPVNPNASPEARALLERLYHLSGKKTLSGQHHLPGRISRWWGVIHNLTGKYPALWGSDFGFQTFGDKDSIYQRPAIIDEAIRKHEQGAIITLMWHAVRPTDDEPNGWRDSVQNELTERQWKDLLTPGADLHQRWTMQTDVIAGYLKKLRDERIPVLWRPYHEGNGGWFWWGGRKGQRGYAALYRMMFDRFVNYHRLDNLIWVWNMNAPRRSVGKYASFWPGIQYVDVLAADVYRNDFRQSYYDDLLELARGKPIAIGECGQMPTPEILEQQPRWVWFMTWDDFLIDVNDPEKVKAVYASPRVLSLGQ